MDLDKLKQYIYTRLDSLTSINVRDGKAGNATFPYLVFNIQIVRKDSENGQETGILTINYWNDSNNDTTILAAAKTIKEGTDEIPGFHKTYETQTDLYYRTYLENQSQHEDPETEIARVIQKYVLYGYAL